MPRYLEWFKQDPGLYNIILSYTVMYLNDVKLVSIDSISIENLLVKWLKTKKNLKYTLHKIKLIKE